MSLKISVFVRDENGKNFITNEINSIKEMVSLDLERIAKECETIIRETIMSKSRIPTGNLASAFVAEPIINGWGVGDIDYLDTNVKYWNHIDKGSEGIGANWSHYLPKGFWDNGRWVENSSGYAGIKPKTPIPAMNYIASTIAQMEVLIPEILTRK